MSQKIYDERPTTIIDLPGVILDHIVSCLTMRDLACMRASFRAWRNVRYATPYVRLDITRPLDMIIGMRRFGITDKVPSLRCELRLSDIPHDYTSTVSLDVDFLKLSINFSDFEMQFLASFLGMFSNLKYLSIQQSSCNDFIHLPQSNVSDRYWASQNLAFIQNLKLAEISMYAGENVLQLVKYLIKNGKNLELIVLRFSPRFWNQRKLEAMLEGTKKKYGLCKPVTYYLCEPNTPKYEEVNEYHKKYARLYTESEKKEIAVRKREIAAREKENSAAHKRRNLLFEQFMASENEIVCRQRQAEIAGYIQIQNRVLDE